MNAFQSIVDQLSAIKVPDEILVPLGKAKKQVDQEEYEIFCKEFVFDKLRELTFGQAFCERFEINDLVLCLPISDDSAKSFIEALGYIRHRNSDGVEFLNLGDFDVHQYTKSP